MSYCVVMRAHNDMPVIQETLDALSCQEGESYRLFGFDNESSDGTREQLNATAEKVVNIPKGTYIPGKVLNQAMRETDGEIVVFLNSDCTPQNAAWLKELVAPFSDDNVAATFGRQIPRNDCMSLHAKDLALAYGDAQNDKWDHGFSMASSAIRRSAWEKIQFNESVQYSEDIEWTTQLKKHGFKVTYSPMSIVAHSHNYNPLQFYKRNFGEGKAEATFLNWSRWQRSLLRYSVLPLAKQVLTDWKYAAAHTDYALFVQSPIYRAFQAVGRRRGFVDGWQTRERYQR